MSKNNSGSANSKKGKSLPKPAVNPASVDLFPTQDEILAEAVTLPNSSVSDVEDVNDDDSVKDADFVPEQEERLKKKQMMMMWMKVMMKKRKT